MVDTTRILLIDDSEQSRRDIGTILAFIGEEATVAGSADWRAAAGDPADIGVAIIGGLKGLPLDRLLAEIHRWESGIPFVLLGERKAPVPAGSELCARITSVLPFRLSYQPLVDALHKARLFREHFNRLRDFDGVRDCDMFRSLIGNSAAIQQVRRMMGQVADTEVNVLITGESGTGKEVVARNLHDNSARADRPFVPINCGAIPRELLESELFGHEKGAFTGAVSARAGRFELADGGTLFLDEIGDMPLNMQVKLLRVLQERSFERVGGIKTIKTDVRILAATHSDLEKMIDRGRFRQDLYYRLNVFPIKMPSLRERAEDVPLLLNELITAMEAENRGSVRFNSGAIDCLRRHPWPGNVRELANLVERMAILCPHGIVGVNDLPEDFRRAGEPVPAENDGPALRDKIRRPPDGSRPPGSMLPLNGLDLKQYLANLEKGLIEQALDDSDGVVTQAADRLHVGRTTLVEKMRKYKLKRYAAEHTEESGAFPDPPA